MSAITLTVLEWRDLAAVLDAVPQKDWATMGEVRKALGAVKQIRTEIIEPMAEYDKINTKIQEKLIPYQQKVLDLVSQGLDEAARKAEENRIQGEANVAMRNEAMRLRELDEQYKNKKIEIAMDGNYKNLIKANWEKLRKNYLDKNACVSVADAFGIED